MSCGSVATHAGTRTHLDEAPVDRCIPPLSEETHAEQVLVVQGGGGQEGNAVTAINAQRGEGVSNGSGNRRRKPQRTFGS